MDQPKPQETKSQQILDAFKGQAEGLDRLAIQEQAHLEELDAQVMRRLLRQMVEQGLLRSVGRTKAQRYFLEKMPPAELRKTEASPSLEEAYPPLSDQGQALRGLVRKPISQRLPVSYQRAFLDAYRPNDTHYLSAAIRGQLAKLGGPAEADRPAGTYAREIIQRLLVDLSWNSARLEGNTYTLLDTERLIELGETAQGKNLLETQMILNHKGAIEFMVASAEQMAVDAMTTQNLHALLMQNLMANPMDEGRIRFACIAIRGTSYTPTLVPQVIEECFRQSLRTAAAIRDPFEQSFFLLVHLPYLQPFMDGNKRTARLAANIPFIRGNYRPITFTDISSEAFTDGVLAVYENNATELLRDIYVFAYERSCARYGAVRASLGEPDPFRLRYREAIKEIVREVVLSGETLPKAERRIQAYAEAKLPGETWTRFATVVETELNSLHDGNFARYQLRPSEFAAWKARVTEAMKS